MENIIKVSGYKSPTRLDRFLREHFKGLKQALIEKALRKGQIKVSSKKATSSLRVQDGTEITLINFEFEEATSKPLTPSSQAIHLAGLLVSDYKIFEDNNILVINKPSDLAVQGGSKIRLSIDDALQYLNTQGGDYKITHRLDKETSGLLLIAKSKDVAYKLFTGFKDRLIRKTYLAILDGIPKQKSGQISSHIAKVESKNFQKVLNNVENGKLAVTDYKVLKVEGKYSLTEFNPLTGRMHQIRVHAQSLGCPILGDDKYGKPNSQYKNLFLHATELIIPVDLLGKEHKFKAPLPEYWTDVMA
jgi:23S rRNA pseudouridine955/2504/2580 synthase